MSRLLLSACLAPLVLGAAQAHAQTPVLTDPRQAALALPAPQPPIPAPTRAAYPGVIRHEVDATDLERRIVRVRQSIPVQAGPLTLLYPKFLPGNHADTGPIQLLAGLTVTGGRTPIPWRRDTLEPYAFHLDVPEGVQEIVVQFQWLTQSDNAVWRVVMTPEMLNMQFEKALLYPAGYSSTGVTFQTSLRLPEGWDYATALKTESVRDGLVRFAPTDLYTLVDSPLFAGAHFRQVELDGEGGEVRLNIVADRAELLAATPEQLGYYEALVVQGDRLFGSRPYERYDFLMGLSDQLGSIGLEHHQSSENVTSPTFFTDWSRFAGSRDLLPHEYAHAWNGKHMQPADELTASYEIPTQSTLLWVYEGQTRYWGRVLAARSGLHSREEALVDLAEMAAFYATQPGREWRPLQDTTNHNLLGYRSPGQWTSWMRGTSDYYGEAALVWLDADTLIREQTDGARSLDDFARAFFSQGEDGRATRRGYTFEDVVAALNAVAPHDWAGFLRTRLDATGADVPPPLDGITRGGYRLVYVDNLTELERRVQSGWASDFQYSLGFSLSGAGNRISDIRWGGPAYLAEIGAGWDLMAVNDIAASPQVLRDAVTAARDGGPIVLTLRSGQRFRDVSFDYRGGLRYPRLERIEGAPDRLGDILAARPS